MRALTTFCGALVLMVWTAWTAPVWGETTAATVTIRQEDNLGNTLADETYAATDETFTTVSAPSREGYIFAYWTVEPAQSDFTARDGFGRALEEATVVPKDSVVTLTAVYFSETEDADEDGVADGYEWYWYGDLAETSASDTDGDEVTFAQELQYGTPPLFADALVVGGIVYGDSALVQYNPYDYAAYTIQSDPEGTFETIEGYLKPGETYTTISYADSETFAYWSLNGVRQADAFGRALDQITLVGAGEDLVAVAHFIEDEAERAAAYWYGTATELSADTDGDGLTLAQEVQYGTSPLFADDLVVGGIVYGDSALVQYNPYDYVAYTIQSDPSGTFETIEGYLKPGETYTTVSYADSETFAYWSLNGVRQADAFGRALDQITLVGAGEELVAIAHFITDEAERAAAYWYGTTTALSSDTDGDGLTLAQEVQYGTNPLFADALVVGGIVYADSDTLEVNLQPFDFSTKALMGETLTEVVASLNELTGELSGGVDFGSNAAPAVVDLNTDDLFDFVVASRTETGATLTVYRDIGAVGAPSFEMIDGATLLPHLADALATLEHPILCGGATTDGAAIWFCDQGGDVSRYDVATQTITATEMSGYPVWSEADGFGVYTRDGVTFADGTVIACDVATDNVTSAALADVSMNGTSDLLVADALGRITYYSRTTEGFVLQHRVWGGTYIGFAEGLSLAPLDWENDGDVDVLAGTSAGKLLLLCDPGVGRPSNLKATAGYDNVLLTWDPSGQSRVSGYDVYRADATAETFGLLAETALPTYRDQPPEIASWYYRVTALVRRWTTGNTTAQTFESEPSEAVNVNLGGVGLSMPTEKISYDNAEITLPLSIDNSMGLVGKDMTLVFTYDPDFLQPQTYSQTALTEAITFTDSFADGTWTFSASDGALQTGSDTLLTLNFKVKAGVIGATPIRLITADLYTASGTKVSSSQLPLVCTLTIQATPQVDDGGEDGDNGDDDGNDDSEADPTVVPPLSNGDVDGDGKLSWEDYEIVRGKVIDYHKGSSLLSKKHIKSEDNMDWKIHQSICQALGYAPDAELSVKDIIKFNRYIESLCGAKP